MVGWLVGLDDLDVLWTFGERIGCFGVSCI